MSQHHSLLHNMLIFEKHLMTVDLLMINIEEWRRRENIRNRLPDILYINISQTIKVNYAQFFPILFDFSISKSLMKDF